PAGACYFSANACPTGNLHVALYPNALNPPDSYADKTGSGGLSPDYYLDMTPSTTGSSDNMDVPSSYGSGTATYPNGVPYYADTTKTYAGITFNPNNYTLVFTGYFVPQTTGNYQFCDLNADNRDVFYLGSTTAFACGNSSNSATPANADPFIEFWWGSSNYGSAVCRNATLTAGYYYPLRSVYGNDGLPDGLNFRISGPGLGTNVTDLSGFIAPSTC
ncbi:hypothetical protein BDV97DRAFT_293545, partial [Delphinella strobiligena]